VSTHWQTATIGCAANAPATTIASGDCIISGQFTGFLRISDRAGSFGLWLNRAPCKSRCTLKYRDLRTQFSVEPVFSFRRAAGRNTINGVHFLATAKLERPVQMFHSKAVHAALLLFLCSSLTSGDDRLPIPDKAAQEKLRQLARDIYQEDYAAAKDAEQKSALAKQIIKSAHDKRDDAAARFVLLKLGQDIAVLGGDVAIAFDAADSLCKLYQLDELETKVSLLGRLSKAVRIDTQQGLLADRMLPLIDAVLLADEYDRAQKLTTVLVRHAKRSKKTARIKTALAKESEVQKITGAYRRIASDLATLEADPVNAAANSAVGRFYCFVKGDWATGVPMLALGGKDKLEALARVEISEDELSADDRVAAGDTLWKLASDPEHERYVDVLKERARFHYSKALPNVDGLVKDKIEKRIRIEVAAVVGDDETAPKNGGPTAGELPKSTILYLKFGRDRMYRKRDKTYVKDLSGGGRDALVNRAMLDTTFKPGALRFGGSHQFVYAPGPWRLGKAFSIAAWVKFDHFNNDYPHILFGEGNNIAFHGCGPAYRRQKAQGHLGFYSANNADLNQVRTAVPLNVHQWYFVVVTDSIRTCAFYLDGRESRRTIKTRPAFVPPLRYLMVGSGVKTDVNYTLNGSIGEIMVINRELLSDEIMKLYQMRQPDYTGGAARGAGIE
jgi:hypothetical protein